MAKSKAKVHVAVSIDAEDYLLLKKIAEEKRISFSSLIRIVIAEWLSHLKNANSQT